jgi:glycosyltransferase involved in cell wall biosynthesis
MLEPPVPFGNAAARWYYSMLQELVARGHEVTAFAACSRPNEAEAARDLFARPEYNLRCYSPRDSSGIKAKWQTLREPFSYMLSADLRADLHRRLQVPYDVLHLEQMWCGWLGLAHVDRSLLNVHYLASIDLASADAGSVHQRITRAAMFAAEKRLGRSYRYLLTCSDRLAGTLREMNPRATVRSIVLALDLKQYEYLKRTEQDRAPVISLIGNMGWQPTASAGKRLLQRLWPSIKAVIPTARLQLVGWNAARLFGRYANPPDVIVRENVPDIKPYFQNSDILLYAPECGSGMKIKVLESLAFGVPVVTTSEGVEGLPAIDGVHAGIADTDDGLIRRAVELLRDRGKQERQRQQGRRLVEDVCRPAKSVDTLEEMYTGIVGSHNSKRMAGCLV